MRFDRLCHVMYCVSRCVQWKPECSQLLPVLGSNGVIRWNSTSTTSVARTPQGAVELGAGELLLGFSAYDFTLPAHYHLPSWPGGNAHESMGLAKLRFVDAR